jgi:predicted porin
MNSKIFIIISGALVSVSSVFGGMNTETLSVKNELYGDFRYSINSIDTTSSSLSEDNNASRLGLKGAHVGDNGITAFYHGQLGLNPDSSATSTISRRFFFGGIKGSFGKVQYGTVSTAYKLGGFKVDPFYDTSAGLGASGRNFGMSRLTNGFVDNALVYTSPMFGNFKLNAATYMDDTTSDKHSYDLGLSFDKDAIHLTAQYLDSNPDVLTALRLRGQYKISKFSIALNYENIEDKSGKDQKFFQINGTYKMFHGHLAASYGNVSGTSTAVTSGIGKGSDANGKNYTVGYFHKLLKSTQVYTLYSNTNYKVAGVADRSAISVGFSHKFSIGG